MYTSKYSYVDSINELRLSDGSAIYVFHDDCSDNHPMEKTFVKYNDLNDVTEHKIKNNICPEQSIVKLINAYSTRLEMSGWNNLSGAIYDSEGELVAQSKVRSGQRCDRRIDIKEYTGIRSIETICIYLGHYNEVYGHFILESLSRVWALKEFKSFNFYYVFLRVRNDQLTGSKYTAKFLYELGIPLSNVIILDEPAKFHEIYIPSPLFDLGRSIHPVQIELYRSLSISAALKSSRKFGRKLYLSRKLLPLGQHKFLNEADIESIFGLYEFDIIYPEKCDFYDQMRAYAHADYLSGASSSALHNSVFSPENTKIIILDGRAKDGGSPSSVQLHLSNACNQIVVVLAGDRAIYVEGGNTGQFPYLIHPKLVYEYLRNEFGEKEIGWDEYVNQEMLDAISLLLIKYLIFYLVRFCAFTQADFWLRILMEHDLYRHDDELNNLIKRLQIRRERYKDRFVSYELLPTKEYGIKVGAYADECNLTFDTVVNRVSQYLMHVD